MDTDATVIKEHFMARLGNPEQLITLFDFLPDLYFFVKDRHGRFILCNLLLRELCGVGGTEDVIGQTDHDFFPKAIADAYVRDDGHVLRTGRRIANRIEPLQESDGSVNWYVTSKIPLYSQTGEIIGIAGMTRDLHRATQSLRPYREMANVLEFIEGNYSKPIRVSELAKLASLSVGQFERRFKTAIGVPPMRYVAQTRINKACHALLHTARMITQIALDAGFYDHSHFTKEFRRHTDMAPREYRRKYSGGG
jgi:PAS domain S-box-containing protein